jgi:hypothetical protein
MSRILELFYGVWSSKSEHKEIFAAISQIERGPAGRSVDPGADGF